MFRNATKTLETFGRSEKGTVNLIMGLAAIPLVLMCGLALDSARLYHAERKLGAVIDAAALAGGKALRDGRSTDAEVIAIATRYFDENMREGSAGGYNHVTSLNVQVDRGRNAVTIEATSQVKTLFWGIAGSQYQTIDMPRQAVARFDQKDIEIGLQLDVTGSMGWLTSDRQVKIDVLKLAVGDLFDIMLPDAGTTNKVRIGLAPFAAGVNAGAYAASVSGGRSADCVYERLNLADQPSEVAPVGTKSLKAKVDLPTPPTRRGRGDLQDCPASAQVMAMTDNKSTLKNTVRAWAPGGSTAGQLGAAWAWYLVSPEWTSIWPGASRPAPYNDGKTMKVAILMTDGIYNTVGGYSNGDHGTTATQATRLAVDTCQAMRNKGVVVYTIGFAAPADAKAALIDCAGSTSKFYDAEDGESLRAAFRAIAEEINNLRLAS